MKKVITLLTLAIALPISVGAQSLDERHQIGIRFGAWSQVTDARTEVSIDGVETSVGNNGAMGGVFYDHWLQENLALDISITGMAPDISVRAGIAGVASETANIGQIHLGVKYYFPQSTYSSSVRPFALASAGPVFGTVSTVEVGAVVVSDSRTETAFSGKLGGGVDFVLGRHFMLGLMLDYNLMTDFGDAIGGSRNYSGPEFGINFGYLFGKGIQ